MNTDAARRASRTYHAKRGAEGLKKVTLWLSPEARAKLEALKAEAGSKDKAAELAIMAYGQKAKAPPAKPLVKATAAANVKIKEALANPPKVSIQIGPVERKPGSLQKGSKK